MAERKICRNKFDLQRFVMAHQEDYEIALGEIKDGEKQSHWMWYIFPQVEGLGRSAISQYYAIKSWEEAVAFLEDSYLGAHLYEISEALLELDTNDATEVFGWPDDMKLQSSMTLFAWVAGEDSVFCKVLDKFFHGKRDNMTNQFLKKNKVEE